MQLKITRNFSITTGFALGLLAIRLVLGTVLASASDITPDNIARAVNQERTQRSLVALNYNTKLAAAADYKANDMINRKYFSHVDPDGNYIWNKIISEGYTPYTVLGENLAIDFPNTEGLMAAWIDSPTHRANILNADFRDQGLGVAFGNSAENQYSVAVANTFGAQPVVTAQPKPAPAAQPAAVVKPEAKPAPAPQPAPAVQPSPAPQPIAEGIAQPQIIRNTLKVTPTISNNSLNIAISVLINGSADAVRATINGKTIPLSDENSSGIYSGAFSFDKYFNYQQASLVLEADSIRGAKDSYAAPLQSYALSAEQNPKSLGDLLEKAQQPDLYNVFKYVVLIFGGLFVIFMFIDSMHIRKYKLPRSGGGFGANFVIFFMLASTLLLVNWWH